MKIGTSASRRKKLITKLDEIVSKIVRAREPFCITCGSKDNLTCSHLITRNKKSIRWNLDNCHCQCRSCNYKHEYFPELYTEWWIDKHGFEAYQKLINEGNELKKYTLEELQEMLDYFNELYLTYICK